jgi:hypothetical protein
LLTLLQTYETGESESTQKYVGIYILPAANETKMFFGGGIRLKPFFHLVARLLWLGGTELGKSGLTRSAPAPSV